MDGPRFDPFRTSKGSSNFVVHGHGTVTVTFFSIKILFQKKEAEKKDPPQKKSKKKKSERTLS